MKVLEKLEFEKSKIIEMLNDKKTITYIAEKLDVTYSTLHGFIHSIGLKTNYPCPRIKRDVPLKERLPEIINLYMAGTTQEELARKFNTCSSVIGSILKKNNLPYRLSYQFNRNFLDTVDSESKSYFLGYFTADGCNLDDYTMTISSIDLDILEKIKQSLEYRRPIRFYGRYYQLRFKDKNFSEKLTSLGCPPRKTFRTIFPTYDQIPKNLIRHYIRGLIDGDGCIHQRKPPRNNTLSVGVAGTPELLSSIQMFLTYELSVKGCLSLTKKTAQLSYEGSKQPLKVLDYLYEGSTIYMDRKHQRYLDFKQSREAQLLV